RAPAPSSGLTNSLTSGRKPGYRITPTITGERTIMAEREWHELAGESEMLGWRLPVIRYRGAARRPGAYLQAALHADEQPGVAVIHELARLLDKAEAERRLEADVTLVPYANPIGLHQVLDGRHMGRFHLASGVNFNRHFRLP